MTVSNAPVLCVMFGPRRGITRTLDRRLLVGRGAESDLQLIDEKVAREHCVFDRDGDAVVLKDLGSRNGTWVNGEKLDGARTLAAGDQIGIGSTVVAYAPDFEALRAVDGESTLILSRAIPTQTVEATDASDDDCAAAGRLLIRAIREDIVPLAKRLLRRHAAVAEIGPDVAAALERCSWPGNVRQLANALERAWVLRSGESLTLADLPAEVLAAPAGKTGGTLAELIRAVEREQIQLALRRTRGVKAQAAEQLGISRPTLGRKIQEYGIDWLE